MEFNVILEEQAGVIKVDTPRLTSTPLGPIRMESYKDLCDNGSQGWKASETASGLSLRGSILMTYRENLDLRSKKIFLS